MSDATYFRSSPILPVTKDEMETLVADLPIRKDRIYQVVDVTDEFLPKPTITVDLADLEAIVAIVLGNQYTPSELAARQRLRDAVATTRAALDPKD